jgi:hypothetical protein
MKWPKSQGWLARLLRIKPKIVDTPITVSYSIVCPGMKITEAIGIIGYSNEVGPRGDVKIDGMPLDEFIQLEKQIEELLNN